METNINYTVVGAFIITLVAFIVLGIIWLSSGLSVAQYSNYTIYMNESVAGLTVDSTVEFNGVDVGAVKNIQIDPHDPHLVILRIRIKSSTPVTRGTRAQLASKGLTGVAFIALRDMGKDLIPLLAKPGEAYPVIATSPSFLGRLDTTLHQMSEDFSKISHAIEALLDKQNLDSIREILVDVRHVTRTLASNTDQLNNILRNTSIASNQFPLLIQNSRETMRILSSQILPAATQAMNNIDIITRNLSVLSIEAKQNPAIFLRGTEQPKFGPGEK